MSRIDANRLRRGADRIHGKYADPLPKRVTYPKLPWLLVLNGLVLMKGETREEVEAFRAKYRMGGEVTREN